MSTMTNILLSYAGQDANYRSLLVAATRAAGLPVRFVEVSGVVTDPVSRRALVAAKLQQCDAVIVLLSPHTVLADTVMLDMATARDRGLAVHGIAVGDASRRRAVARAHARLDSVLEWNWPRLAAFLQRPRTHRQPAQLAS